MQARFSKEGKAPCALSSLYQSAPLITNSGSHDLRDDPFCDAVFQLIGSDHVICAPRLRLSCYALK